MSRVRSVALSLLGAAGAALALGLGAGCAAHQQHLWDPALQTGPFYAPVNVHAEPALPADLRRVLLLPVCAGGLTTPEHAANLDGLLFEALQRQQRFEAVRLERDECKRLFGATEIASVAALPHGLLTELAARHAVDAVLFVDLTAVQTYQPQRLGFRAKLATVRDVRLVWSFDETLSASDAAVRNSARRRYYTQEHGSQPFDLSPAALQSPGWFTAFAADEMFRTLPRR